MSLEWRDTTKTWHLTNTDNDRARCGKYRFRENSWYVFDYPKYRRPGIEMPGRLVCGRCAEIADRELDAARAR